MRLSEGEIGGRYQVQSIQLPVPMEKHLEALGITRGTTVSVLNSKNQGVLIVKVRGTRFAMGKNITKNIEVKTAS